MRTKLRAQKALADVFWKDIWRNLCLLYSSNPRSASTTFADHHFFVEGLPDYVRLTLPA